MSNKDKKTTKKEDIKTISRTEKLYQIGGKVYEAGSTKEALENHNKNKKLKSKSGKND